MGYQWVAIDANFDRSLQFTKVRWDLSQSWNDGFFSELPNIDCDNKGWTSITGAAWGYAGQYTMNLSAKKCYIRNQSTGSYALYDMYAISTQVDTNIYEYEYSVPLYWGGVSNSSLYNRTGGLGISVLVQTSTFEISPTESAATYESGTTTITVNTDNDSSITWTASTNDSWLSLSTLTGAGDGSVTVTYAENQTLQNRTGTVTFVSSEGDVLSFTIEQEKKPALVYDRPIYRSGNLVKKMYRSGELIYLRMEPVTPVPPGPAYNEMPLTFEILGDGNIVWGAGEWDGIPEGTIFYSKNGGEWTEITPTMPGSIIPVVTGDIVQFKGDNPFYCNNNTLEDFYYCFFGRSTASFKIYGNIMSLCYSTGFENVTSFRDNSTDVFEHLFEGATGLTDAENLVMPVLNLTMYCYARMFYGCTNLVTAPVLPAPEVGLLFEYKEMFRNCASLAYVKCLAYYEGNGSTHNWLNGVSPTGTFVKDPNANWPTGVSGIPSGWTVLDAE